jgi:hypothetical protein
VRELINPWKKQLLTYGALAIFAGVVLEKLALRLEVVTKVFGVATQKILRDREALLLELPGLKSHHIASKSRVYKVSRKSGSLKDCNLLARS